MPEERGSCARAFVPIQLAVLPNLSKEIRGCANGFRGSKQEKTVGDQCIVKQSHELLLGIRLQVNQHILTDQQIEMREWRITQQIVLGKDSVLTQGRADLIPSVNIE